MAKKYFVDRDHKVMGEYYDFLDSEQNTPAQTEKKMMEFIKTDPAFLDPYLLLFELYQNKKEVGKARGILERAYQIAIKAITDRKGNWPEEMLWGHLENRHIIRTLLNKAMNLWVHGENDAALNLLRKLLRSNPGDNIGARNYILAIRLGMKFEEFETQMASEYGYDGKKMMAFEKKMKKFPDEFDWWFKAVNEEN